MVSEEELAGQIMLPFLLPLNPFQASEHTPSCFCALVPTAHLALFGIFLEPKSKLRITCPITRNNAKAPADVMSRSFQAAVAEHLRLADFKTVQTVFSHRSGGLG